MHWGGQAALDRKVTPALTANRGREVNEAIRALKANEEVKEWRAIRANGAIRAWTAYRARKAIEENPAVTVLPACPVETDGPVLKEKPENEDCPALPVQLVDFQWTNSIRALAVDRWAEGPSGRKGRKATREPKGIEVRTAKRVRPGLKGIREILDFRALKATAGRRVKPVQSVLQVRRVPLRSCPVLAESKATREIKAIEVNVANPDRPARPACPAQPATSAFLDTR